MVLPCEAQKTLNMNLAFFSTETLVCSGSCHANRTTQLSACADRGFIERGKIANGASITPKRAWISGQPSWRCAPCSMAVAKMPESSWALFSMSGNMERGIPLATCLKSSS